MPGKAKRPHRPNDPKHLARCLQASFEAYRLGQSLAYHDQLVRGKKPEAHWLRLADALSTTVARSERKANEALDRAEREAVDSIASRLRGL